MIDLNKRKIVFAYIPDYLFINDEKTPYGLLCLKEVLESSNQYTAEIWDYNLNLFNRKISNTPSNMIATFNMIAEELSKIGADAISFYTMCSNFYCCIPIARKFKEICPNTPCLFAGPHATCIAQNILEQYPFIDYVSMGEAKKVSFQFSMQSFPTKILLVLMELRSALMMKSIFSGIERSEY